MKAKFSSSWLSSVQPRKQRKYQHNAPLHIKHKFLSAHLSKELRKKHGKRSIPIRKGDEVLIMRGEFKKKKGKILEVLLKEGKVSVENITRAKKDGAKINVFLSPSNLQIVLLNLEDKLRLGERTSVKTEKTENKK